MTEVHVAFNQRRLTSVPICADIPAALSRGLSQEKEACWSDDSDFHALVRASAGLWSHQRDLHADNEC